VIVAAVDLHLPAIRMFADQRAQERRLPGAVEPDDRGDLPASDVRAEAAQDRVATQLHYQIADRDQGRRTEKG
jgi:hypothetical protein